VVALDAEDGAENWSFTPGGPVDTPPTLHEGLALFGCGDGHVYCLRASDGALVWRFRAAPQDRRTLDCEQLESVWPVHGSVLVLDGVAYVSAGRSTYLDGGIRLYGLAPQTGRVLYRKHFRSEHGDLEDLLKRKDELNKKPKELGQNIVADWRTFGAPDRADAFHMAGGALNDVLTSDGQSIYMKHERFSRELKRQKKKGRHLFSTSRLVNDVEVHRSHWVLGTGNFLQIPGSYTWLANRRTGWTGRVTGAYRLDRPYGLMLAFGPDTAWVVWRRFNKRARYNKPGYVIFEQSCKPLSAPVTRQSDVRRFKKPSLPEMKWSSVMMMRPRAMLKAGSLLFFGGGPEQSKAQDALAAYRGKEGGLLWVYGAVDGEKQSELDLDAPPVWDGMAATRGRLYLSLENGRVVCLEEAGE
jgi:hypothetical protein